MACMEVFAVCLYTMGCNPRYNKSLLMEPSRTPKELLLGLLSLESLLLALGHSRVSAYKGVT